MASFLSGLLGMSEQELRFHVQRANRWTVAPLFSIFPALSASQSVSSPPPSASPVCESLDLPLPSQSPQTLEGQSGEQTRSQSDALAFPSSPCAFQKVNLEVEDKGLSRSHSEEELAGWREELPHDVEEEAQCSLSQEGSFDGDEVLLSDEEEVDAFVVGGLDVSQSLQGASMSQLDDGCLAKIMSHMDLCTLHHCSLVSRDWLEASNFARSSMKLQESAQIAALPTLLARFSRIQTLIIQKPSNKDISACRQSQQTAMLLGLCTMELIAQGCCHLQKLQLQNCSISDAGLAVVLRSCPDLQSLHLRFSEGFSGEAFSGLCCKLEKLELRGCKDLTCDGLLAAAAACAQLEDLGMMSGQLEWDLVKGLEGFAKSCPRLRALASHGCGITDQALSGFAACCPLLQRLSICCEDSVTDAGLAAFFAELPLMHTVMLSNNRSILGLPSFWSNQCLRTLRLELLRETTEVAFQVLANQVKLERLELICCPTLTNTTLERVFASCKSLKGLKVYAAELLTATLSRHTLRAAAQLGWRFSVAQISAGKAWRR